MRPPHELLEDELEEDDTMAFKTQEMIDRGRLPPSYFENPVVRASAADSPPIPLALYQDGVQYSKSDTVVGFWLINLVTGSRSMITMVRKSILCQCGCRGWDTMWPILASIRWSLESCARGEYPRADFLGRDFAGGSNAAALAGQPLRSKAIVLQLKGDWAEFCERFGYPSPKSVGRPCFCCNAHSNDRYSPAPISLVEQPWVTNTEDSFRRATELCEIRCCLRSIDFDVLVNLMQYDKRAYGKHGLVLQRDYAPLNLLKGDRLEPSYNLPDVNDFFGLHLFPTQELTFWRVSRATLVWHRCPLWCPEIGLTATDTIAIDLLHTYYLGPLQVWVKLGFWSLIDSGIWGSHCAAAEERQAIAIAAIGFDLLQWYASYDRLHPGKPITRLHKLTSTKLGGGRESRNFKYKAMETWGAALFLLDYMEPRSARLGEVGRKVLEAGPFLVGFMLRLQKCGPVISVAEAQDLMDRWKNWMACAEELSAYTPKAHLMYHLILRSLRMGNPVNYSAFTDESLNRTLRDCLRLCHQRNFELLGMLKVTALLKRPVIRRRLR